MATDTTSSVGCEREPDGAGAHGVHQVLVPGRPGWSLRRIEGNGRHQVNAFPVVEPGTDRLVGVISREHVMDTYNRESARRDLAGEFSSMVNTLSGG